MANDSWPMQAEYVGPKRGWFLFVHHGDMVEWSDDITPRVAYVEREKKKHELPVRRRCMRYVPAEMLPPEFVETRAKLVESAKYEESEVKYCDVLVKYCDVLVKYRPELEALAKRLIPDCPWDGTQLVFPKSEEVTS